LNCCDLMPIAAIIANKKRAPQARVQVVRSRSKSGNGAVSARKDHVGKYLLVLLIVLTPYGAVSQIGTVHGTIIVLNLTNDELVIAADSMGTHGTSSLFKPDYAQCKIVTFDNQIVFAGVNNIAYEGSGIGDPMPKWDARSIVADIVHSQPSPSSVISRIDDIASKWASSMAEKFRAEYKWHPGNLLPSAKEGKGMLLGGLFAESVQGILRTRVVLITFNPAQTDPVGILIAPGIVNAGCWACGQTDGGRVCAAGQPSVIADFCTRSTDRAKGPEGDMTYDKRLLELGWTRSSLLALRLADLTEAYDPSGTVGGPIDVVELKKNGGVHWIARKDNCPDTYY
jgi:hypothetical protein